MCKYPRVSYFTHLCAAAASFDVVVLFSGQVLFWPPSPFLLFSNHFWELARRKSSHVARWRGLAFDLFLIFKHIFFGMAIAISNRRVQFERNAAGALHHSPPFPSAFAFDRTNRIHR